MIIERYKTKKLTTNEVVSYAFVGSDGFEPPKASPADLQSAPFGHSGNYPFSKSDAKVCFYFENKECFSNYLRLLTKNPFLFC